MKRKLSIALLAIAMGAVPSCSIGTEKTPSLSNASSAPTTDAVENYIRMAAKTRDGFHTVNAVIFRPDDPRLKYDHEKRSRPAPSTQEVFAKLEPIASFNDPSAGPQPTDETDQVEARMLMDETLIGTGYWKDSQTSAGEMLLVFLDPCSATMPQIREKYGPPTKTIESGRSHLHFYGRMIFVEVEGGKIHSALRRAIKGTQKVVSASPQVQENTTATKGIMCYTVSDNRITVRNTPWGDRSCVVENSEDASGGRPTASLTRGAGGMTGTDYKYNSDGSWKAVTTIYVGKMEPRIKVTYSPASGVESVTVDGKKVPGC